MPKKTKWVKGYALLTNDQSILRSLHEQAFIYTDKISAETVFLKLKSLGRDDLKIVPVEIIIKN